MYAGTIMQVVVMIGPASTSYVGERNDLLNRSFHEGFFFFDEMRSGDNSIYGKISRAEGKKTLQA
jgi:hypothetical protein